MACFGMALALAGCDLLPMGAKAPSAPTAAQPARAAPTDPATRPRASREVEAPEVFAMEEPGLWDGRPSLGGVWVAHPEVEDPERVAIQNVETGASVTGALFRRERDNPGPRFQISSEAANALGILPGAPTPVRVVALRPEDVAPAAASAEAPTDADGAAAPPEAPGALRGILERLRPPPAPRPQDDAALRAATPAPALQR